METKDMTSPGLRIFRRCREEHLQWKHEDQQEGGGQDQESHRPPCRHRESGSTTFELHIQKNAWALPP
jgi:hypothetical protein